MHITTKVFITFLILFVSLKVFSQPMGSELFGTLYNNGSAKIDLWIKKPKNSCGNNAKKFKFYMMPTNVSNLPLKSTPFISWKIDVVNCDGYRISKFWSIDISQFLVQTSDQVWELRDWDFDADFIESQIHSINLTPNLKYGKDQNLGLQVRMSAPASISGSKTVMKYEPVKLSVIGGSLSNGGKWVWFKDDCGKGKFFDTGNEITIRPDKTTKYFVRGEDGTNSTSCAEITVVVDNNSTKPDGIDSEDDDIICEGTTKGKRLSVRGGKLGYKSKWVWYENAVIPGNKRHVGETYEVFPSKTTTYLVRAESDSSNTTVTAAFTVRVAKKSLAPTSIELLRDGVICENDPIELKVKDGQLGEASEWMWFKKDANGKETRLENGVVIKDQPNVTAVYTVYAFGRCELDPAPQKSLKVDVNIKSIAPLNSSVPIDQQKNKNVITLPPGWGVLGTNAEWVWYKDAAASELIGKGSQITSRSTSNKRFYVRAEGVCNTSDLVPISVTGLVKKKFSFVNVGILSDGSVFNSNRISNFQLAGGIHGFYFRATLALPSLYGNKTDDVSKPTFDYDGTRIINYPSNTSTYYTFNERIYSNLRIYSVGFLNGKQAVKTYFGAGYGFYDLYWGVNTYKYGTNALTGEKWAKYSSKSLSGPSVEAGLFLKVGHINLMGGITGIYSFKKSQQYITGQLGVGLALQAN